MDPLLPSGDAQLSVFDSDDSPGEIKKFLQSNAKNDPRFQELQTFLIDWINGELKEEHIVVKSLEEDLYDGLVLHHLLKKIAGMKLEVEEIVLSANSQKRKLGIIMEAISQSLQLQETDLKWSINEIHNKDLLCTLHLIVALAQHFRPDLELPSNVAVEVIKVEAIMNEQAPGKPEPDTDGAGEPVC
ncbi:gamma-parvin-like isoform X1 [Xenopus laevis]|uniref:Gamma-parvin-like isoform X1 n=1 Tax=Xenopus laevis TaxID=8355 RepID=A0A8J1MJU1_XENLA|nr:gamma-parvin-like isoform X1 [Xenopus laevis]